MFTIQQLKEKGRAVIASQDIIKETLIMKQDPIIFIAFKENCSNCLKSLVQVVKCQKCLKMEYCSLNCLEKDSKHLLECKIVEKYSLDPNIMLHYRALQVDLKDQSLQGQAVSDVEGIYLKIKSSLDLDINFEEFKGISRKLCTNSIGITRDLVNIGIGIYETASFMNHDCMENTILEFRGKEIRVKASRDIRKGEEITTRYLPIYKNRKSRMEEISYWNFKCRCNLCLLQVQDSRDLVKCQNCDGITNENYFKCEWCQEELILDFPDYGFKNGKNRDSKGIKREITELQDYLYKNHEILLTKREELIQKLEEENELKQVIGIIQEQIKGLQDIFKDRLSVEIAFLEYKRWKYLEILQENLQKEYIQDVYNKVVQVFGKDHDYSLDIARRVEKVSRP